MKKSLREAIPFAEAFSKLLHPMAEVVIHNLSTDKIEAIYNPISRREVGDNSYLDRIDFDESDVVIGPYSKTNWDGRALKSISIVLRDSQGKAEGFLCVNMDISSFRSFQQLMEMFIENNATLPKFSEKLFKEDLYEKINLYVQKYCRENQVSIDGLNREDKQKLIISLEEDGAFEGKNAADYIGRVLGISRATVYNYLKERIEK